MGSKVFSKHILNISIRKSFQIAVLKSVASAVCRLLKKYFDNNVKSSSKRCHLDELISKMKSFLTRNFSIIFDSFSINLQIDAQISILVSSFGCKNFNLLIRKMLSKWTMECNGTANIIYGCLNFSIKTHWRLQSDRPKLIKTITHSKCVRCFGLSESAIKRDKQWLQHTKQFENEWSKRITTI